MITLSVLGPLRCWIDGVPVDIGGWRQRAVLARLVVAHGRVVSGERLLDDLWGDNRPPHALTALHAYVSRLRRAMEPHQDPKARDGIIVTSPPGYRLELADSQVDAWHFESLLQNAEHISGDRAESLRTVLGEAVALWRGDALAEFDTESWAGSEIRRLNDLRLTAHESRGGAAMLLELPAEAVVELESVVREAPLRESAWHLLALSLHRCGRHADALAAIRRARSTLIEEAGLEMGRELRQLEAALLSQDEIAVEEAGRIHPVLAGAPVRPDAAAAALSLTEDPFVGREDELDQLLAAASSVAGGNGRLVLVEGTAGIGKTRLVSECATRLRHTGWVSALGRCVAQGAAPAGFAWLEILDDLTRQRPDVAQWEASRTESRSDDNDDVVRRRFDLVRGICGFLEEISVSSPVLIVLDDLQRAEPEALQLLDYLVRSLAHHPVMFLCTLRPSEVALSGGHPLQELASSIDVRVPLHGLTPAEVGEVVRARCPRFISDADIARITRRTGGNVFFVRQVTVYLTQHTVDEALSAIPAGVRDLVRHTLSQLPTASRDVVNQVAILGTPADAAVVLHLNAGSEDELFTAVEGALDLGVLEEGGDGQLRFLHDLARECVVADLSELRRRHLHHRIAEALCTVRPDDYSTIAHHLAHAEDPRLAEKVVRYSRLAAEDAEDRYAFDAAASLWQQAENTLATGSDVTQRWEMTGRRIRSISLGGNAADAREVRSAALAEARLTGDAVAVAGLIVAYEVPSLWLNQEYGMLDQQTVGCIEWCLGQIPAREKHLRCQLLTCLALELEWSGGQRGREAAAQAVRDARALRDPRLVAAALAALFRQSYRPGELALRESIAEEIVTVSADHNLVTTRVLALLMLAECACARGRFPVADRLHTEVRELAAAYQLPSPAAVSGWYTGLRHLVAGRFDDAEIAYRIAAEASSRARIWESQNAWVVATSLSLAIHTNTLGDHLGLARLASDQWPALGCDLQALCLHAAGRSRDAAALSPPAHTHDAAYLLGVTWRAIAGLRLGDSRRIRWAYEALLPYIDEFSAADTGVITHGPVALLLGHLAAAQGDTTTARRHYRHALEVAERTGSAYWPAQARTALAGERVIR